MTQLLKDIRIAADIVTEVLLELKRLTKPGVSLDMLDEMAERMIIERGGTPYNKGYHPKWAETPYPATICCAVDHEICHAPPHGRPLKEGSIVKYDLGVRYGIGCGDAALTVAVGEIDNRKERAMRYGLRALEAGIKVVKAGVPISAIGTAISDYAGINGYTVIKQYCGHHIGKEMHEEPFIPHYYRPEDETVFLKEGDVICIEPLLTPADKHSFAISDYDGWTSYRPDGQVVVMFEHMILVGKDSCEILTKHI
jgi:methionyl aminopeptidase